MPFAINKLSNFIILIVESIIKKISHFIIYRPQVFCNMFFIVSATFDGRQTLPHRFNGQQSVYKRKLIVCLSLRVTD